jgi:hypothetical protein
MATTFQALGMKDWEKFMRDIIEEPENYEAAAGEFINAQGEGFNWEYFPRAVFEQAGQIAGSILARGGGGGLGFLAGGPGGALAGAFIGPALFEAIQIAGPVAMERASRADPPRAEPNWDDWKGALSTSAFSGVLNAFGIRGVGVLNDIGRGTIKQAGKQVVKGGVSEGVTEGFQGLTEQVGGTARTAQGLEINPKAAFGEGLLGAGAGTGTQVGTEILGQVAPPTQDGTLYSNPFTRLFGKKEEAEEAPEPTAVPEETPPQIEDQRDPEQVLMEQLYGELETEAQKIPTLRKYLDPVTLRGSLISGPETEAAKAWDEDVINTAYEGLAQEIEKEFEATDVPKENRGPILQDVLDGVKREQDLYVTSDLIWDEGITPDNMFRTQDILFGLVKPKIAELSAEVEPAVEETNLFEPDEYTRPMYNAPNFTNSSSESGAVITTDVPVGRVNRVMSDPSIGLYMGEPNKLGFYPDKIDPKTLGHSVLRKHLLAVKSDGTSRYGVQGVTKPGNPDKLFKSLFLDKNELGFPIPKKGVSAKNKKIALQAISTGVAQRLLDLKTQGRTVEVAELDRIIDDYYSRFQHVHLTDGNPAALEESRQRIADETRSWAPPPSTPDMERLEARFLGKKSVDVMYEELMRSPLFENQEPEVSEFLANYYSPGVYNSIYEDLIDIAEGNASAQQRNDAIYNNFTFDPGVSPQWLTEAQYAEIENKIYPKYRERMESFIDKELPAVTPLLAPGKIEEGAWENVAGTRHKGIQLEDYSQGKYSEGFPGKDIWETREFREGRIENPYYFKPKESVIGTGINDEIWYSFNPRLSKEKEAEAGLSLDARRSDPRHYDKSMGGHAILPGTLGWTRGIMGEFGPGLYGKMIGEFQQDVYRQGQKGGPDALRDMRFRSLTGEAKLTPSEKVSQKKLDNIENALNNVFGRGGSVYESALFAPFMQLERDTGVKGEFSSPDEYALDPDRYPRYILKDLPARRNGFLRRIPGIGDARKEFSSPEFRMAQARFYRGLPDQGMNIIPGGDSMSTRLLKNIADQMNSAKINGRLQRTRDRIYGDWLLESQPFRVLGRELNEQDIATHLRPKEGPYDKWGGNWLEFFGPAIEDSEIQSKVADVESVRPFIDHLVYQQSAPFILEEARPWAMEQIRSEMNSENFDVEVAPVIDALMNPDENLTDEKIKKLEKKEETGDIRPENIIPDVPHQGTTYGAEGEIAKDMLHREIYELLTTYPDANVLGLQRYGTSGSPGSMYKAGLAEAKKLAAENPSISIVKIAEFPITRREGRETVQRMQEIWLLIVGDVRENIILDGGVEGMMKGGLVKKATNQVLNYGDYGRRYI